MPHPPIGTRVVSIVTRLIAMGAIQAAFLTLLSGIGMPHDQACDKLGARRAGPEPGLCYRHISRYSNATSLECSEVLVPNSKVKRKIRGEFTLGEGAAEYDGLLLDAFYETSIYRTIIARHDQRCFLIGRTGSGKSACFRRLEDQNPEHVIRLNPEDLSLPYIADLDVVQKLKALDVHLDPLFIALWKHVIIIEIIKHRYRVDSPDATQRFIDVLMDKLKRDKSKQEALSYLQEFEGRFWCETNERVREIIHKFETQVKAEAGGSLKAVGLGDVRIGSGDSQVQSLTDRSELVNKFQRLVNDTQLPRMNRMVRVLDEDILDSSQQYTYLLIDDLDRDWADEKVTNDLIRCLFRAVVDLKRVDNLKILVALRTNIFEALDFGRTGGQEEKFRDLIHRVHWTEPELKGLLNSRVSVAATRNGMESVGAVSDLLPRANSTMGDPLRYILSRTLMRPRDAIAFLNECFALANGREKLSWVGIKTAEKTYSTNRLLALRDEWKPTFPGIDRVFAVFNQAPIFINWPELVKRLDDCALLIVDRDFPGTHWMTEYTEPIWAGSESDDRVTTYHPLIRLLHNIGFIGCIRATSDSSELNGSDIDEPAVFNQDDPSFPDYTGNLRQVERFIVHAAFRPALDITATGRRGGKPATKA